MIFFLYVAFSISGFSVNVSDVDNSADSVA